MMQHLNLNPIDLIQSTQTADELDEATTTTEMGRILMHFGQHDVFKWLTGSEALMYYLCMVERLCGQH